jgi:hypothetical protein
VAAEPPGTGEDACAEASPQGADGDEEEGGGAHHHPPALADLHGGHPVQGRRSHHAQGQPPQAEKGEAILLNGVCSSLCSRLCG